MGLWARVCASVSARVRDRAGDTSCVRALTADTDHAAFKKKRRKNSISGREAAKLWPGDSSGIRDVSWRVSFRRLGTGVTSAGTDLLWRPAWEERFILEATEQSHREGELSPRRRQHFVRL